jgi:copper chaperone CopZ
VNKVVFEVPNISCGHCVHSIQTELGELDGVTGVWADQNSRLVEVEFGLPATEEQIKSLLSEINYPVKES